MCFLSKKKAPPRQIRILTKSPKPSTKKAVKLIVCGNAAVGKTSIAMRYKDGKFTKDVQPTLAGVYQEKKIKLKNGDEMQLNMWDTAGDQRFRSIMPVYYREAQIALLVYDLTNTESFQSIDFWLNELLSKVQKDGILICLVGNKKDLVAQRKVSRELAVLKAKESKLLYQECSAFSGEGIEEIFEKVVGEYCKGKGKQ